MELLNTIRPICSLFTLATWVQSLAKVLPTNPHVGIASPTWLGGLRLGGGRCWAGSIFSGTLWEETPPRRKLHAQLLCHLHVVPGVDIVKDTAACQLHLEGKGKSGEVVTGFSFSNPAPTAIQLLSRKGNLWSLQKQFLSWVFTLTCLRILEIESCCCCFLPPHVFI